jgi:hypothetical protein
VSIWTSLEPTAATVDAGGSTTVTLRVRNTGDLVESYRLSVVGDPAPWATVEPPTLNLYPGTTGTATLTFSPPRGPEATAGPHPFAVRVQPAEQPDAVAVPEGVVSVTPFTDLRTELLPATTRGRLRGRAVLAVDNLGNTPVTASVGGKDPGSRLRFELRPGTVQVEPGRAAFVRLRIAPPAVLWGGQPQKHPYQSLLLRSGEEPLATDGEYVQPPLAPRWAVRTAVLAGTAAVAFAVLWFTFEPGLGTRAVALADPGQPVAAVSAAPPAQAAPPAPAPGAALPPAVPGQAPAGAGAPAAAQAPAGAHPPAGGGGPTTKAPAAAPAQQQPQQPAPQQPAQQQQQQQQPQAQQAPSMLSGRIRNVGDNLVIDIYNGTTTNGTGVTAIEYRPANVGQGWNRPVNSQNNTFFRMENQLEPAGSVVVMDEDMNSHQVNLWAWGSGANQEWWVDSTTTPGAVYIHNRADNNCLTENGIGQQLTVDGCQQGDPRQLWAFS